MLSGEVSLNLVVKLDLKPGLLIMTKIVFGKVVRGYKFERKPGK